MDISFFKNKKIGFYSIIKIWISWWEESHIRNYVCEYKLYVIKAIIRKSLLEQFYFKELRQVLYFKESIQFYFNDSFIFE